jgi:membrane-associated phospholipid phosphatase
MAVAIPAGRERTAAPPAAEPLRGVDYLVLGYLAVASAVAVARAPDHPGCWWLVAAHGLMAALVALLTRPGLGSVGRGFRELYPLFLLPALYGELDVLNGGAPRVWDGLVQRWELAIFGSQVSREWWQAAPSRLASAVLHAAYLSYYAIVAIPALVFVGRRERSAVRDFVVTVMATFLLCYLAFLFFPVAGPYYQFPRPDPWFTDNPPARLVYRALSGGSSYGAAFPSSHVAASVAAVIAAARWSPRLGWLLLAPTALLTVAVVYCQMHYGVDALAGLAVGACVALATRQRR